MESSSPEKIIPSQTNDPSFSIYALSEVVPFASGRGNCSICDFSGSAEETKRHLSSREHLEEYQKANTVPSQSVSWWEKRPDETEDQFYWRYDVSSTIGRLPEYVEAVFAYGTVFFVSRQMDSQEKWYNSRKISEPYLRGLGFQHFAHKYGFLRSEFFVSCDFEERNGRKAFGSYKTIKEFLEFEKMCPRKDRHFYEQILDGMKVREYWDIEKEESEDKWDIDEMVELFCEARKEYCPLDNPEFSVLESCGSEGDKHKFSLHLIGSCVHENRSELGKFCIGFIEWLGEQEKYSLLLEFVDRGVYTKNRTFRCPGSTKRGSKRRMRVHSAISKDKAELFITADQETLEDRWLRSERCKKVSRERAENISGEVEVEKKEETTLFVPCEKFEEALIKFVDEKCDGAFDVDYSAWEGSFLTLKRRSGHENICPVCTEDEGNEHNGRDAFAFIQKDCGALMFGCFKTKGRYCVVARREEDKQQFVVRSKAFKSDFAYCSPKLMPLELPKGKDCLILRSAMGTGKTKEVAQLIKNNPGMETLVLSFRVSLAEELSRKLPGATLYSDPKALKKGHIEANILVCQIDSLCRVMGKYDIVVIDEASYTLNHLCRFVKNAPDCWTVLKEYIKKAKQVILLDAFMGSYITDFMGRLGRKCYAVENTFKPHYEKTNCIFFSQREAFEEKLFLDLEKKLKIVLGLNCKTKTDSIAALAESKGYRVKKYTSETRKEDPVVNVDEWTNYDLVLYTPTISAGVSFEKQHFDKCYGYFVNDTSSAEESCQMLFRARNLEKKEMNIYVQQKISYDPITEKEVVERLQMLDKSSYRVCGLKYNRTERRLKKTPFNTLFIQNEVRNNISKRAFAAVLKELLRSQGVSVTVEEPKEKTQLNKDMSKVLLDIEKSSKVEELRKLASTPCLTDLEYYNIENSLEKTKEQELQCKKYDLATYYGMEQEDVTLKFLEVYKKQLIPYWVLRATYGKKDEVKTRLKKMAREKKVKNESLKEEEKVRINYTLEKTTMVWELLDVLGYAEWHKDTVLYKKEFDERMAIVEYKINRERGLYLAILNDFPRKKETMLRWFNGVLRYLFGFFIQKKNSNNSDATYRIKICAPWRFESHEIPSEHFVPIILDSGTSPQKNFYYPI